MNQKSWINMNAAFEFLLEELEAELAHMENVAGRALQTHRHDWAREFSELATVVTDFRNEVRNLQKQWQERAAWIEESEDKFGVAAEWRAASRYVQEPRTPLADYFDPLLQAIHRLGDAARTEELARALPELMQGVLTDADRQPLAALPRIPRWRNALVWALRDMVADGWLEPAAAGTPADVWRATEGGQWRRECAALDRGPWQPEPVTAGAQGDGR